ncbi:MAG: radical SAM protein [Deltaproteobacteria bacterium]|nr:MAG: radical SAM protein [Deltaproteobacteria bacterium]
MTDNLKGKFCPRPFEYLELGYPQGDKAPCFACCPTWVPTIVGDIGQQSVSDIWNSKEMQNIRASILDESFSYCNHELCPEIRENRLLEKDYLFQESHKEIVKKGLLKTEGPKIINFSNDRSCNLECPSCRTEKIMWSQGEEFEKMEEIHQRLLDEALESLELMIFCSSGDPFASKLYRKLLFELEGSKYPKLKIQIVTNGQLFTPEAWEKMEKIQKNIDTVYVSVDAATPDTYRVVRKGGELEELIPNLKFLGELRRQGKISLLQLDFVVQQRNYREMPEFVKLGKEVGADKVFFQKVVNWGTWTNEIYEQQAIWKNSHPEHQLFLDVLSHPLLKDSMVKRGNLSDLLEARADNIIVAILKRVPGLRHLYIRTKQLFHGMK